MYDYLDLVENPMDFDRMLTKLDDGAYKCAQDFLNDIDLIANNAIAYNSDLKYETNKIICHRARALQDFCYALVKSEMDTDFEDECKDIVKRREKLSEELSKPDEEASGAAKNTAAAVVAAADGTLNSNGALNQSAASSVTSSSRKKKPRKKASSWARGESRSRKRPRRDPISNGDVHADEEDGDHGDDIEEDDDEDDDSEIIMDVSRASLNEGTLRIDQSRINTLHGELVAVTEGYNLESLERVFARLSDLISGYKRLWDRTKLPSELHEVIQSCRHSKR